MKGIARIALPYAVFAAIATAANHASRRCGSGSTGDSDVPLSILVGTAVGRPSKYVLKKRFIFDFQSDSLAGNGCLFVLYNVMGGFTTALFWGIEYAFHLLFGADAVRYLYGLISLTLGYVIKYQLDKCFAFVNRVVARKEAA